MHFLGQFKSEDPMKCWFPSPILFKCIWICLDSFRLFESNPDQQGRGSGFIGLSLIAFLDYLVKLLGKWKFFFMRFLSE